MDATESLKNIQTVGVIEEEVEVSERERKEKVGFTCARYF